MPNPPKWTQRKFDFDFPADRFPVLLERLRGTPARLEDKIANLPAESLPQRPSPGQWSAQEHAGHLIDLEELLQGRIDDFLTQQEVLRPADMSNRKTEDANYNEQDIQAILKAFRATRGKTVATLEQLPPAQWEAAALHPRLQQPMRLVDLMLFFAEHDDHHLVLVQPPSRTFPFIP